MRGRGCRLAYRVTPGVPGSARAAATLETMFADATARAMWRHRLAMALVAAIACISIGCILAAEDGIPAVSKFSVAAFGGAQALVFVALYAWPGRSNSISVVSLFSLFCARAACKNLCACCSLLRSARDACVIVTVSAGLFDTNLIVTILLGAEYEGSLVVLGACAAQSLEQRVLSCA